MWWTSVRSIIAVGVAMTFCYMGWTGKVEAKDFTIIVVLVFNYYFLNKARTETQGKEQTPNANFVPPGGKPTG